MKIIILNSTMTFKEYSNDPVLALRENTYFNNDGSFNNGPASTSSQYMKFGSDPTHFKKSDFSANDKVISSLSGLQVRFVYFSGTSASDFIAKGDNISIGSGVSILTALNSEHPNATHFGVTVSKTSSETISQAELDNVSFQIAQ